MSKQFLGLIAAIILIFTGIIIFSGNNKSGDSSGKSSGSLTQHIQGQGKSGVTLVEYGDYQCPFCGNYYPIVKQVQAKYNEQIFFQFRNFPLTGRHPNAFAAARAAEAAAMQNKFWEMHDALYESQDPNGQTGWVASDNPLDKYFVGFAQQLGLDTTKFKSDYASPKVNSLINADLKEGARLGVEGTPTFFIDGKKVTVEQNVASFDKVISEAIAKKSQQ